ncbi:AI-2E family transporter [Egbenema bharatensis]|uniref:AI-2E family transporter n=1 Tax=Egbenema bharatensis TaxID=3463334 RepID=UPI003A858329
MKFGHWLGLAALILSFYILWEIRQLLLLLFVAIIFATALNRLVRQWQRVGVSRGVAAAVSVIGVLAVLTLFMALIVPPFLEQFQQLTLLVPLGLRQLEQWLEQLLLQFPGDFSDFIPSIGELFNQVQPLASGLANNVIRLFSGFINLTGGTLFVIIFTVMLLINPQPYRHSFIQLVPSFYRRRTDQILTMGEADLVSWIIGTLFNMLVIGVVSGIVLWILGVKLVLANALLAGLMEAIPNVGPFLSAIPPIAIALLDSPWKAIAVLVAYFLIQQLEQFLLVPVVMGQQVSLLPAITLLSQIVFASFFGFLGLFLAIPLVVIVRVLVREILVRDVLDQWKSTPVEVEAATVSHQFSEPPPSDPSLDSLSAPFPATLTNIPPTNLEDPLSPSPQDP